MSEKNESRPLISIGGLRGKINRQQEAIDQRIETKCKAVVDKWMETITADYIEERIVGAQTNGFTSVVLINVPRTEYDQEIDYGRIYRERFSPHLQSIEEKIESYLDKRSIRVFPGYDLHVFQDRFQIYLDWGVLSKHCPSVCFRHTLITGFTLGTLVFIFFMYCFVQALLWGLPPPK